ncbi:MAG: DUF1189 family protein [Chloroflexi bacterium]|jgi:hypothetical protein|nr:DUF1189 family protein [Chloroflexota bacterium]
MTIETSTLKDQEPVTTKSTSAGCLGEIGWFLSGAVLPFSSLSYYRKAAQKSVGSAVLFFVVFTLFISTLSTISIAISLFSGIGSIQQAYVDGDIPSITISNGNAVVDGEQPYVLVDGPDETGQNMFVGVDTTGIYTEIDPDIYYQGFLMTETELHMLTPRNGYQSFPLSDLNTAFEKDPIIINADTVSQAWVFISLLIVIFGFIFLAFWNTIIRLMIILVIALFMWGIVTLLRPKTGFEPIIITGLFAIVPAIYLSYLFERVTLRFPGLQTFFLLVFWTIGLLSNFLNVQFVTEERPLRLWTALIGIPVIITYIVDVFVTFPSPYGVAALWAISLITGIVIIGLRLFLRLKEKKPDLSNEVQSTTDSMSE